MYHIPLNVRMCDCGRALARRSKRFVGEIFMNGKILRFSWNLSILITKLVVKFLCHLSCPSDGDTLVDSFYVTGGSDVKSNNNGSFPS